MVGGTVYEQPWHEDEFDEAAGSAARRFDIDDDQARDLVGLVAGALEDGETPSLTRPGMSNSTIRSCPVRISSRTVATTLGYEDQA